MAGQLLTRPVEQLCRWAVTDAHGLRFERSSGADCLFNMCTITTCSGSTLPGIRYHRQVSGLSWGSVFQLHKGIRISTRSTAR